MLPGTSHGTGQIQVWPGLAEGGVFQPGRQVVLGLSLDENDAVGQAATVGIAEVLGRWSGRVQVKGEPINPRNRSAEGR